MQNINFDEGIKSFTVNGDKSRVIRFNPSDSNIIKRVKESEKRIAEFQSSIDGTNLNPDGTLDENCNIENAAEVLEQFNLVVREELNHVFNADVYDIIFGRQSPLCIVGPGKFLFEAFLDAVIPEIKKEVRSSNLASKKRIEKYTKEYHR